MPKKRQEFNWEQAYETRNPATLDLIKKLHKQAITEDEFVYQWLALPHHSGRTTRKKPAKMYQYLKNRFGFFTGELA